MRHDDYEARAQRIRWAMDQIRELMIREIHGEVTVVMEKGLITRIRISESRHPEKLASG